MLQRQPARRATLNTPSQISQKNVQDSCLKCPSCKVTRADLLTQVGQLKDKAHQSFMQVMQIQQLHEEELQQLRAEYQERQAALSTQAEQLRLQAGRLKQQMAQLQKNVQRHSFDLGSGDFYFGSIQMITCDDEGSCLDQSALLQFRDLVSFKSGAQYVNSIRKQFSKDKTSTQNKAQVEKLLVLIRQLKDENGSLVKKNQDNRKLAMQTQQLYKSFKVANENLNKDNKFISEQLKRLTNQKIGLEKKVRELQRDLKEPTTPSSPKMMLNNSGLKSSRRNNPSSKDSGQSGQSNYQDRPKQITQLNYAKFMNADQILGGEQGNILRVKSMSSGRVTS